MADNETGKVTRCMIVATGVMAAVIDSASEGTPDAAELLASASVTVQHLLAVPGVRRVIVKTETEYGELSPSKLANPRDVECPTCYVSPGNECQPTRRAMVDRNGVHPARQQAIEQARS